MKLFTIALLATVAAQTLCSLTTSHRELQTVTSVSWDEDKLAKFFAIFWETSILICFILLIVDAVMRFGGNKLGKGATHSMRFIWFIYGSAAVYFIGSHVALGYREFMGHMYRRLFEFTYKGYYDSGSVEIFSNTIVIEANGQTMTFDDDNLLENQFFFELILFIGLRIAALATSAGLKNGNPLSNLLGTLRRIVGAFFALRFMSSSIYWYQFMNTIRKILKANTSATAKRAHFNIWLSWFLSFYLIIEVCWACAEIFIAAFNSHKSKSQNYQESENPGSNQGTAIQRSYDTFVDDVAFMFFNKSAARQSIMCKLYNPLYFFRWILFAFIGFTWWNKVRTVYFLHCISDIVAIVWTILVLKQMRKPAGILILVSETFLFFRHLLQWINWLDFAGDKDQSQAGTDWITVLTLICYVLGTCVEFALLFEPLYGSGEGKEEETVNNGPTPSQ